MVTAYILIVAKAGSEKDVVKALTANPAIKESHIVYGQYDIICKVDLADVGKLNDFILTFIRPLKGIEATSTLISAY